MRRSKMEEASFTLFSVCDIDLRCIFFLLFTQTEMEPETGELINDMIHKFTKRSPSQERPWFDPCNLNRKMLFKASNYPIHSNTWIWVFLGIRSSGTRIFMGSKISTLFQRIFWENFKMSAQKEPFLQFSTFPIKLPKNYSTFNWEF